MDRRSSRDDQHRVERHPDNPNVFDDEFEADITDEEDYVGVSDGFRPSASQQQQQQQQYRPQSLSRESHESPQARRSISAAKGVETQQPVAQRSSIAKPPLPTSSSFAMANDGSRDPFSDPPANSTSKRPANAAQALMHRASVASTSSFATTTTGPRSQTPAGPSHPYAMYPQGTGVARSSSVTTTSTFRNPQESVAGERPQHPYGMYPQNPVDDDGSDAGEPSVAQQQAIPVGFPGLNTGYHRQIGPDGEEQDIIGPDGHTEQLPPYSRYPEEGPTKASLAATASATSSPIEPPRTANGSQDALIPASAIATTAATPTTNTTAAATAVAGASTVPAQPVTVMAHVQQTPSAQESQQTEKNWKEKNWSEKRRTRVFCGRVPLWLVILLVGLLVLFAIILGAAIGSMLSKAKDKDKGPHNKEDAQAQVTATQTLFDASNIPAPTNAASIVAIGTYEVPLDQPEETQKNCIIDSTQVNAWSCNVQGPPVLINVVSSAAGDGSYIGWFQSQDTNNNDNSLQYGVRAPTIPKQPMQFVKDWEEPTRGPALHFQTLYDKVVVLPENFVISQKARRGAHRNDTNMAGGRDSFRMPPGFKHRNQVQPGDFPWVCRWNATFIEVYLYVSQNSTFATQSSSSSTTFPTATPFQSQRVQGSPVIFTTPTPSPTSATLFGNGVSQTTPYANLMPRYQLNPRGGDGNGGPKIYPRVVKVEERRIPNSQPAVCEQMQINDDGSVSPRRDNNGVRIVEYLKEVDPSMNDFLKAMDSGSKNKREGFPHVRGRDEPSGSCHCQWMVQ